MTQFYNDQEVRMPYSWEKPDGTNGSGVIKFTIVRQVSEDEYLVKDDKGETSVMNADELDATQ